MAQPLALIWDLLVKDQASSGFLRVAGAADKAAASTAKAQAALAGASAKMATVGAKMTKSVTLPLLGIAAVSVNMAAKFQQSTNVLVTAAGESEKNLKMVRKGILDIAATTGTSWKEVTDGMYQLEKAGYRGADALKVERAAAQGAREEGASLNTVTAAMTSIMASYHLKASDAVKVMNQMKTAAGESKTTMEQFAGSLSTVLPLASANKISFADIAGSLASLTQHGTSADEAAQELAFTMRGLAAPNMVAQKMMSQLGISSVDVATKLGDGPGGRGLAGTLNYLSETVLHKMGPSGLVLLNTFNQSKMAAADARTEFAALAPETQKMARQFLDGSITMKDWNADIKYMTPHQASLAKQFAVTSNNARGFQQALRNGTSGSLTYSDAIKKMTGGANGLNTVLQLTGESMDGTNHRIKAIADSALGAGKNVSGWASTQKLASVQLDIFKQSMARMAIEIGTALLPALTAIVEKVSSAVQWFQNLGDGTKKFIGITLLVGAALGPLIGLVAKLTRGFVILWGVGVGAARLSAGIRGVEMSMGAMETRSYSAGLAVRNMSTKGITAAKGLGAALGGAAIGVGLGMITRNSDLGTKALGALGSTALGAAQGFAMGGPWGALIGGGTALLGNLATSLFGAGDAAKKAVPPEDDYTQAILKNNGALGLNVRALTAHKLTMNGSYDAALKLGISVQTLTDAAMGQPAALAQVNNVLNQQTGVYRNAYGASEAQIRANSDHLKQLGLLKKTFPEVTAVIKSSQHAAQLEAQGMSNAGKNDKARTVTLKALVKAQKVVADSLGALNGQLFQNIGAGTSSVPVLTKNIQLVQAFAKTQFNSGSALDVVNKGLADNIGEIRSKAIADGISGKVIDSLLAKYKLTPKQIVTNMIANINKATASVGQLQAIIDDIRQNKVPGLNADTAQGRGAISALQSRIDTLNQKYLPSVDVNVGPGLASLNKLRSAIQNTTIGSSVNKVGQISISGGGRYASGGVVRGPGTGTSDSIHAPWVSNGEFVVRAAATALNLPLLHAINSGRGYANGGQVKTSMVPSYASLNRPGMSAAGAGDPTTGLLASIDRKLDQLAHLRQVGPDVADALNGAARTAAHQRQTVPAGRNW